MGYKGSSKIVTSDYLFQVLKLEDDRRSKKLHNALYVDHETVPMHYVTSSMGEDGALIIVADGTLVDISSEVEESTVNANKLPDDLNTYNVGDYVKKVEEVPAYSEEIYLKAATLDIETENLDFSTLDVNLPTATDEEMAALYTTLYNKVFDPSYQGGATIEDPEMATLYETIYNRVFGETP